MSYALVMSSLRYIWEYISYKLDSRVRREFGERFGSTDRLVTFELCLRVRLFWTGMWWEK